MLSHWGGRCFGFALGVAATSYAVLCTYLHGAGGPAAQRTGEPHAARPARAEEAGWKTVHMYVGQPSTLGKRGQLHSQKGQDWLVASLLGCKRHGFFVELAANDAYKISNSLLLERDFAWDGLCIEPNTRYYYGHGHRKCTLVSAVVASPGDAVVTFSLKDGYGGIVGRDFDNRLADGRYENVSLPTVPFEQVLRRAGAPAHIDYLSLDVEGAEEAVVSGFPFDAYTISVITVERPPAPVYNRLYGQGFRYFQPGRRPDGDQVWISERLPSFGAAMGNASAFLEGSCMAGLGYARPRATE